MFAGRCDRFASCSDSSDELDCSCDQNEFKCHCYNTNPVTCPKHQGCIPSYKENDGTSDCPDDSDENQYRAHGQCNQCYVTIKRFQSETQCEPSNNFNCDVTTCYHVSLFNETKHIALSNVICSNASKCSADHEICSRGFLCDNNGLTLAIHFCDGKIDCLDGSDETRHRPGFKCVGARGTCVLPQINLYDEVAQCSDQSDLCFSGNASCFQCLDKRLWISSKQVCDGTRDCFDSSDECLCEDHFNDVMCIDLFPQCDVDYAFPTIDNTGTSDEQSHNHTYQTIKCQTKYGEITARLCDGHPECRDFSDECNCTNRARFCDDDCHSFYPLGDRYCDGYEDEAWTYINDSNCPKGFDERFCPNRFRCKAGDRVSISVKQRCDAVIDCDDDADELNCPDPEDDGVFSSKTEMIDIIWLQIIFWIMAFVVIAGNSFVITKTACNLKQLTSRDRKYCFHMIVLNISIADFIMGIYLSIIAVYSAYYSGRYGSFDVEWRSSLRCEIIGCLAIVSSETTCFLMVVLTAYRLYKVYFPLKSLNPASRLFWNSCISLAWLAAVVLAVLPILDQTSYYFAYGVWFKADDFTTTQVWRKEEVAIFACRLSRLTNISLDLDGGASNSVEKYLRVYFPEYALKGEFGYYGETSVCLPRFFISYGDYAWEYTFVIITINSICFLFISFGYFLIILKMKRQKSLLNKTNKVSKQEKTTHNRIAIIILTDMLCWVPICIMAYAKLGGGNVFDLAYIVSAGLLLPINSAFNPFLLTSLPDKCLQAVLSLKTKLTKIINHN